MKCEAKKNLDQTPRKKIFTHQGERQSRDSSNNIEKGVFRVKYMHCLGRTNVVQSFIDKILHTRLDDLEIINKVRNRSPV